MQIKPKPKHQLFSTFSNMCASNLFKRNVPAKKSVAQAQFCHYLYSPYPTSERSCVHPKLESVPIRQMCVPPARSVCVCISELLLDKIADRSEITLNFAITHGALPVFVCAAEWLHKSLSVQVSIISWMDVAVEVGASPLSSYRTPRYNYVTWMAEVFSDILVQLIRQRVPRSWFRHCCAFLLDNNFWPILALNANLNCLFKIVII